MSLYFALKNGYIVNSFIWDGVESFSYPDNNVDLLLKYEPEEFEDFIPSIGDYWDEDEFEYIKITEKPEDENYPSELDYLWVAVTSDTTSNNLNWGYYIPDVGDGTSDQEWSVTINIPTNGWLALEFENEIGNPNNLLNDSRWDGLDLTISTNNENILDFPKRVFINDDISFLFKLNEDSEEYKGTVKLIITRPYPSTDKVREVSVFNLWLKN